MAPGPHPTPPPFLLRLGTSTCEWIRMPRLPQWPSSNPPQSLRLCVRDGRGDYIQGSIHDQVCKLFNAYGDRKNVDWNQYVFVCMADGRELDPESSAFEQRFLDMQMIECRPRLK
ncbi:hypothetical protein BASA82_000086 [Batrachochytrium salamandrivorans]|nr:hypothetical protein BASA82_000086 [Batrachochytrium salamandrivorans]